MRWVAKAHQLDHVRRHLRQPVTQPPGTQAGGANGERTGATFGGASFVLSGSSGLASAFSLPSRALRYLRSKVRNSRNSRATALPFFGAPRVTED